MVSGTPDLWWPFTSGSLRVYLKQPFPQPWKSLKAMHGGPVPWALLAPFFFLRVSAPLFLPPIHSFSNELSLQPKPPQLAQEVGPLEAMGAVSAVLASQL